MDRDHLDDDTLNALVAGRLSARERLPIDAHLDGCVDCRALAAELVRLEAEPSPFDPQPLAPSSGWSWYVGALAFGVGLLVGRLGFVLAQ